VKFFKADALRLYVIQEISHIKKSGIAKPIRKKSLNLNSTQKILIL